MPLRPAAQIFWSLGQDQREILWQRKESAACPLLQQIYLTNGFCSIADHMGNSSVLLIRGSRHKEWNPGFLPQIGSHLAFPEVNCASGAAFAKDSRSWIKALLSPLSFQPSPPTFPSVFLPSVKESLFLLIRLFKSEDNGKSKINKKQKPNNFQPRFTFRNVRFKQEIAHWFQKGQFLCLRLSIYTHILSWIDYI